MVHDGKRLRVRPEVAIIEGVVERGLLGENRVCAGEQRGNLRLNIGDDRINIEIAWDYVMRAVIPAQQPARYRSAEFCPQFLDRHAERVGYPPLDYLRVERPERGQLFKLLLRRVARDNDIAGSYGRRRDKHHRAAVILAY